MVNGWILSLRREMSPLVLSWKFRWQRTSDSPEEARIRGASTQGGVGGHEFFSLFAIDTDLICKKIRTVCPRPCRCVGSSTPNRWGHFVPLRARPSISLVFDKPLSPRASISLRRRALSKPFQPPVARAICITDLKLFRTHSAMRAVEEIECVIFIWHCSQKSSVTIIKYIFELALNSLFQHIEW
jgi:hypothetical protein